MEKQLDTGLIKGHAYGISSVKKVYINRKFAFSTRKSSVIPTKIGFFNYGKLTNRVAIYFLYKSLVCN